MLHCRDKKASVGLVGFGILALLHHQRPNPSEMICCQGDLRADTDAACSNFAEQWVVLNQREESLTSIEEPPTKIVKRHGVPKNAFTDLAEVLVDCDLKLIANGLGGFNLNTKN